MVWARGRHLMDAARTLIAAQDERAEEAVQKAVALGSGSPFRLLTMEAGLLAVRMGLDPRIGQEAHRIVGELDHDLGSPEGFRSRWLEK